MPKPEIVQQALQRISKRAADYEYFFDRLSSPEWIKPLFKRGMFQQPPEPIRQGDYVSFPFWPESRYLSRMASKDPETVLDVIGQMPETENFRVHSDLIEAALAMPTGLAPRMIPLIKRWLTSPYQMILPDKVAKLVIRLAGNGQAPAALELARALLAVVPDDRRTEADDADAGYRLPREPKGRMDDWHYERALEEVIPVLVSAVPLETLVLLSDVLESAIAIAEPKPDPPTDHSYVRRSAIEDSSQDSGHGVRNFLISALRDASEEVVRSAPSQLPVIIDALEQRLWRVFHRLALHLLREFGDAAPELARQRIIDTSRADDIEQHHEYWLLIRDRFNKLSKDDQATILDAIEAGPAIAAGSDFSEPAEAARYTRHWQLRRLAVISRDALPESWQQRYDDLAKELGEPDHPEFLSYSSGIMMGPNSPKAADELGAMSPDAIVAFLKEWEPPQGFMLDSPEGLSRSLAAAVGKDPGPFAPAAPLFQEVDPTYVRGLLSGLGNAAKEERPFDWRPVLALCRWVLDQPFELEEGSTDGDKDSGWAWTRREIAYLLCAGFQAGEAEVPEGLRGLAWDVLDSLTRDYDPTPEHEARYGGSNMDPVTLSLNTTRGEALNAAIQYGLWMRRHLEAAGSTTDQIGRGFDAMPELRTVLDAHLQPEHEPSLAVRSVYGRWFPWLALLDPSWAAENVSRIFPVEEVLHELRDAAWEAYVAYCDVYDSVFELLREEYAAAIQRIGGDSADRRHAANPDQKLAEHLMAAYWRGKAELDEPDLLLAFFDTAPDSLRGHALSSVGHALDRSDEVPPEMLDRLQVLWTSRLVVARERPVEHSDELAAFGWWFGSGKFEPDWSLRQLIEALRLTKKIESHYLVAERLAEVAETAPMQAVGALRLMVEADVDSWGLAGWSEEVKVIITSAIAASDSATRQAAVDLIHYLGARGYQEFRELLPTRPPDDPGPQE
jgi:hypothetical protein